MTRSTVGDWIEHIMTARATSERFIPEAVPVSPSEAYAIQSGVVQRTGPVGGFKTALKGDAPPIMAPIFAQDFFASGAQVAVKDRLGVELEVGLRLVADCPTDLANLSLADFARLVEPVAVIELVDTRTEGPRAKDAIVKLADNQINAGLVVGDTLTAWSGDDIGAVDTKMTAGDTVILDGSTTVPGGSALATFAALARQIGAHCGGLKRGQIVITGSLHPLVYFPKGTLVQGRITGIGSVSVLLE